VGPAALVRAALDARARAYVPYSRFAVGAALLADDGTLFTGCNVENASYGLTLCAERVAVHGAVAAGRRAFAALAVATGPGASLCGACRQVLAEFAEDGLAVHLADASGAFRSTTLGTLLPDAFRGEDLRDG